MLQDTYILEAGLQNDVELPYTCRGGICGYASSVLPMDFPPKTTSGAPVCSFLDTLCLRAC